MFAVFFWIREWHNLFGCREVDDGADAEAVGINARIQIQNFIDALAIAQFAFGDS